MVRIKFGEGLPGIRGALAFSPETTKPLCELVEVLLCGSGGTRDDRSLRFFAE
jgi:hypothetical protein